MLLLIGMVPNLFFSEHSLIRGVVIQSCPAGPTNFTNYVFCHPQFSGVIQNIENRCAIFNILDNTTELWMTKYIIGEFFSSSGATLYNNPSDQTVYSIELDTYF